MHRIRLVVHTILLAYWLAPLRGQVHDGAANGVPRETSQGQNPPRVNLEA